MTSFYAFGEAKSDKQRSEICKADIRIGTAAHDL
jgi:hypothetical protein